jgi:hypothetical protein
MQKNIFLFRFPVIASKKEHGCPGAGKELEYKNLSGTVRKKTELIEFELIGSL